MSQLHIVFHKIKVRKGEYYISLTATDYKKLKRRKRFDNDAVYKAHLKFLADNCRYYPKPVIYTDEIWIKGYGYMPNIKPYYKRQYRGNHKGNRYQWCKKYANRSVRNYEREIAKGAAYKRIYDYWLEVD